MLDRHFRTIILLSCGRGVILESARLVRKPPIGQAGEDDQCGWREVDRVQGYILRRINRT